MGGDNIDIDGPTRSLFIVGAGRAGLSFARAAKGWQLAGVWGRTESERDRAGRLLDAPIFEELDAEMIGRVDVVLLPVVDDAIADMATRLVPLLGAEQVLLHTSGSRSSAVMASDAMVAHLGSCHPLQALASPDGNPEKLRGATFGIEGDEIAISAAAELARACGGLPVEIATDKKVLYHASAVVAANFMTVLMDAAVMLMTEAGAPDTGTAVAMLLPLLRGTVDNLATVAPGDGREALARSMTGPLRRGDVGTVSEHLDALAQLAARPDFADLPALYRTLAARGAALAAEAGVNNAQIVALLNGATDRDKK